MQAGDIEPSSSNSVQTGATAVAESPTVIQDTVMEESFNDYGTQPKRSSQEPVKKRQRKSASRESFVTDDLNIKTEPVEAEAICPAITRRGSKRRSSTPRKSPRGKTPVIKTESSSHGNRFISSKGDSFETPVRPASKEPSSQDSVIINSSKMNNSAAMEVSQLTKTQETTIQVEEEGIVIEEEGQEDYRDFMPDRQEPRTPGARGIANPTSSSRRSTTRPKEQPVGQLNKVKTGRISKFKEGSMNDRASTRPPQELLGYAYGNSAAPPASESSRTSGVTSNNQHTNRRKPHFLPRKYTGDEAFTFGGFINSMFQFRGIEYCKENLWGPTKQRLMDKLHVDLQKFRQDTELNEIKAKAEAVYKIRKEKEWKEMEIKKRKATEELRRRKQRKVERKEREKAGVKIKTQQQQQGRHSAGIKRKYGEMAESFGSGVNDRAWDADAALQRQLEEGEKTEEDAEMHDSEAVGEDWNASDEEESELDAEELAQVQDLVRTITGKAIIAHHTPSRPASQAQSLHSSPRGRGVRNIEDEIVFSQVVDNAPFNQLPLAELDSDESDHAGCGPSFLRNGLVKGGGTVSNKSSKPIPAAHTSKAFDGVIEISGHAGGGGGSASSSQRIPPDLLPLPPGTPPPEARKFTKRELAKQERLMKKVSELESKLLDAWRELEAVGGVKPGLRVQPPPGQAAGSGSARSSVSGEPMSVSGASMVSGPRPSGNRGVGAMGPPPLPMGKK